MQSANSGEIWAAFVGDSGGVELKRVPKPPIQDGSILVKMEASGICGTDLEKLSGRGITSRILGHEVAGVVTESRSKQFKPGDRVVPHHHVACNNCDLCRVGAQTLCEGFRTSNFIPGGFAEEFLVPEYNVRNGGVHPLDANISFIEASFAEPMGCCIRGLESIGVMGPSAAPEGRIKNVLVVGAGPIGLLHMELLRATRPDAKLTAVDVLETRLKFAENEEGAEVLNPSTIDAGKFSDRALKLGGPLGYDLVIVATGSEKAFAEAFRCARKSGSLLLFGAPHKGAKYEMDLADFFLSGVKMTSSYATSEVELDLALDLLNKKKINAGKFVSRTFPLEQIAEAMSEARAEGQIKVVVTRSSKYA